MSWSFIHTQEKKGFTLIGWLNSLWYPLLEELPGQMVPKQRLEGCKITKLFFKLKMIGLKYLWEWSVHQAQLSSDFPASKPLQQQQLLCFGTGSTACLGRAEPQHLCRETHTGHERQYNSEEVTPGTNDRPSLFFVHNFVANLLQLSTADHLEPHTFLGQLCTTQIMFLS